MIASLGSCIDPQEGNRTAILTNPKTGSGIHSAPTLGNAKVLECVLEVATRRMMAGVLVILYALSSVPLITMTKTTMWFGTMEVQETGRELLTTLTQSKLRIKALL